MPSLWIHRHMIVVPVAARTSANTAAAQIDPDDGANTFSVPLSVSGNEPATHYGCNSAATEAMRVAMQAALGGVSGALYWRTDAATGVLQATNVAASLPKVGQVFGWNDALADAGLKVIHPVGHAV